MVERWDPTDPLPPARPVPGGPPPVADGTDRYPAPLPEPQRRRALRLAVVVALVVAVAIALGQVWS